MSITHSKMTVRTDGRVGLIDAFLRLLVTHRKLEASRKCLCHAIERSGAVENVLDIRFGPRIPEPTRFPWEAVIGVVPHLLWATLLLFVLLWIGREALEDFIGRVQKLGFGGVEIEFRKRLESAARARAQIIPEIDLGRASRRLTRERALVQGARLLWIDDLPDRNHAEINLLESVGAHVNAETTSAAAESAMNQVVYDLIVSDIDRERDKAAGIKFAEKLTSNSPPIIFYVGAAQKPAPPSAFGLTDRPDELVHLILDALARTRS
jgi:hypothetical protein